MLIQRDTFSRTHSYAINKDSFRASSWSGYLDVVVFSVTKSIPTIAMGSMSASKCSTVEEFIESDDLGINTLFKWNGVEMWSSSNKFVEEMNAWNFLDKLYRQSVIRRRDFKEPDLTVLPGNYEGWFARK